MYLDNAVHSDFLIHWTGKDLDYKYDQQWYDSDKSQVDRHSDLARMHLYRLHNILKYGLWLTEEPASVWSLDGEEITIPSIPKTCFTELKLSESRRHARLYGCIGRINHLFYRSEITNRPLSCQFSKTSVQKQGFSALKAGYASMIVNNFWVLNAQRPSGIVGS